MEDVLAKLVSGTVNYAIRSGIALTASYAVGAGTRLLKNVKGTEREEIASLQARLESKIRIISPPIDMIELITARGNTTLESALSLTKQIRMNIQDLGSRLNQAASDEERIKRKSSSAKTGDQMKLELNRIISDMRALIRRIDDAVPLLMLAITTSGANLSTQLPSSVSPSRLLQASTFLSAADRQYGAFPGQPSQVGPVFNLSVYMLFAAHSSRPMDEGITDTTWKEVIRKARVKLMRVPLPRPEQLVGRGTPASPGTFPAASQAHEFAYRFSIVEDLDDDRVHEDEGEPFDGVAKAGIREFIPIYEISKIFYADTGKILKIGSDGEPNNPILLLKRDPAATPPRRMMQQEDSDDSTLDFEQDTKRTSTGCSQAERTVTKVSHKGFPRDLDPEWIALEVYTEAADSDSDTEDGPSDAISSSPPTQTSLRSSNFLTTAFSGLRVRGETKSPSPEESHLNADPSLGSSQVAYPQTEPLVSSSYSDFSAMPAIRASLSLLELLIRLTSLQQFQQASHLTINDEFLNYFLSESNSTGAGADSEYRKRLRRDVRSHIGFDPYDESPVKLRGEEYIRDNGHAADPYDFEDWDSPRRYSQGARSSPGPRARESPSPSLTRHMQQRLRDSGASRSSRLRNELEQANNALGRSGTDSTLGTSPRSPADAEYSKERR